ncbi:MAG: nucleoside triphosphate pyrophosphohydrolase [Actinobacteria bacterium HGW-Actinobacteria-2]|nr:MAG: nucleoside triphosphate pyrophosphohydrolase [Actinobacteria bacterium HGW-Actinobacteria-2]
MTQQYPELARLASVMHRLRKECPWDAAQTHESLVHYLIEETLEVVEAIEAGSDADLREELGDLLLQVYFHAEIAAETGRFDLEQVAARICDKLIARHPYVFTDAAVPDDLNASWERAKAIEKSRDSVLDGIPERLSALSRAKKILSRAGDHGLDVSVPEPVAEPETATELGEAMIALVARARALGVDPEQAARTAVRQLEDRVRETEAGL